MIKLVFCNQNVLVWDPKDVSYLRKTHRIVGSFVGSLPGFTQQNTDLGLPLLLMPEEARHLVDTGVAVVVQYAITIDDSVREFYTQLRQEFCQQNAQQFRADRVKAIEELSDKIIAGKLKKFAEKYQHMNREDIESEIIRQELDKIPDIKPENCATKVYTSCPFDKRVGNVIDFTYPTTSKEVIRYEVFKQLWRQNYYITDGIKFGCDFLAYETDPIGVHSKFMVICCDNDRALSDLDIQMYGRLAKSVRKNILIAFYEQYLQLNDYQIIYKTIKWEHNCPDMTNDR